MYEVIHTVYRESIAVDGLNTSKTVKVDTEAFLAILLWVHCSDT